MNELKVDLCVSAALSAVKDQVQVPWKRHLDLAGSSRKSEPFTSTETGEQAVVVTETSDASVHPGTRRIVNSISDGDDDSSLGRDQIPRMEISAPPTHRLVSEIEADFPTASKHDAHTTRGSVQPRILAKRHFDVALSEIRPSSTEEGTLPELRKVSH